MLIRVVTCVCSMTKDQVIINSIGTVWAFRTPRICRGSTIEEGTRTKDIYVPLIQWVECFLNIIQIRVGS